MHRAGRYGAALGILGSLLVAGSVSAAVQNGSTSKAAAPVATANADWAL